MRRLPPARRHVVGREREQFERMPLRIAKLEHGDSSRIRGQSLRRRSRDRGPAPTCAQPQIGGLHVGNDDGDVLESWVVAADIGRIRRTAPGECEELDRLFAQSERERAGLRALDAGQSRKACAAMVLGLHCLEAERLPIERPEPVGIGGREADPADPNQGHWTPRRFRKTAYSVCDAKMNSLFFIGPPKARLETRYGNSTFPMRCPCGSMQCTPSPALLQRLPSSSTRSPSQ